MQQAAGWPEPPAWRAAAPPAWPPERPPAHFWRRFFALFLPGLVGVATLPLGLGPAARRAFEENPSAVALEFPVFVLLTLVNPTIMLAAGVTLGVVLAYRVGLRSRIDDWISFGHPLGPGVRSDAVPALAWGAAVAVVVVLLDLALRPWLGDAAAELVARERPQLGGLLTGLLYGGITEELIRRWGVMTLFVWSFWRLLQRNDRSPRAWVLWSGIAAAALLFGLAHLPATALVAPLTVPVVVRALVLNALAAFVFGWLYWRRSLEAAMIAHMAGHIVFFGAALLR
jgi:hypothetical protein